MIVILHYHLQPGGVTRVINSQAAALTALGIDTAVICGAVPEGLAKGTVRCEPEFMYLDPDTSSEECRHMRQRIIHMLRAQVGADGLLHVHNPNLGKNPVVMSAVHALAAENVPVVLHCHDFAEDRPANMQLNHRIIKDVFHEDLHTVMYPQYLHCRYAVLNSADADRLEAGGIPQARITLLPNPVVFEAGALDCDKGEARKTVCETFNLNPELPIHVFPVRVIRRKNIGEYILLAMLFADQASWLVTMAPRNPIEVEAYTRWKAFAAELNINVVFEAGEQVSFPEIMHAADQVVTTSTAEGFGMMFLEPWVFGCQVAGRDLPMVTDDFRAAGMQFDRLYSRLSVPGASPSDFAELTMEDQMALIRSLHTHPEKQEALIKTNNVSSILFADNDPGIVSHNTSIIETAYSQEEYGRRLSQLYRQCNS